MRVAANGGGGGGCHPLQMTWQPKSVKRKHGSPPLGLRNLGNTCYLNSVLQCLTYTPPLANFCLKLLHSSSCDLVSRKEKKGECPFCILEKRIVRSLSSEAVSDAPLKMNNCLRIYAEHFRLGRQEDAHEFLRYVIDACHNTCLRLKKLRQQYSGRNGLANGNDVSGTGETVVKEIFGGALRSQVKCLSCGAESNKVDEIMDISLDILHCGSLVEALQKFFEPEILDGNNKYKCDHCKKLVAARKQMSILQAPNVLVVQLKRFEGAFCGKIDKAIEFNEILLLSSNMCKESQDQHPEYHLFGTVVHSGFSPDSGHYYAYIKDATGRWYCCDDSCVQPSTIQEVLSQRVYILFFSRTKQRPQATVDSLVNGGKSHETNGSKMLKSQMSVHLENSGQVHVSEPNDICKTVYSNGTGVGIQKSGGLGKDHAKMCMNQFHKNNATNGVVSNDDCISLTQIHEHDETALSVKDLHRDHSERRISISANGSNFSEPSIQKSVALAESVNIKESSNHHSQTSISNQQKKLTDNVHSDKLLAHGNVKFSISKKESKGNTGCKEASTTSVENEKPDLSVGRRKVISKESADVQKTNGRPCSVGLSDVKSRTISVYSSEKDSASVNGYMTVASQEGSDHQDLQNGNIKATSRNSERKRKSEDTSSIFHARDDESQAKMHALKKMMEKEASLVLRSCGWYDEVENLLRARKKLFQEPGSTEMSDDERKSALISHAKKTCLSKVPESLKASLVDRLRLFSQEQKLSEA